MALDARDGADDRIRQPAIDHLGVALRLRCERSQWLGRSALKEPPNSCKDASLDAGYTVHDISRSTPPNVRVRLAVRSRLPRRLADPDSGPSHTSPNVFMRWPQGLARCHAVRVRKEESRARHPAETLGMAPWPRIGCRGIGVVPTGFVHVSLRPWIGGSRAQRQGYLADDDLDIEVPVQPFFRPSPAAAAFLADLNDVSCGRQLGAEQHLEQDARSRAPRPRGLGAIHVRHTAGDQPVGIPGPPGHQLVGPEHGR